MKKKYLSVLSTTMTVLLLSSQTFGAVKWNTVYDAEKNPIKRNTTIIGTYKFPNMPTKVAQYMEAARSIKEGEPSIIAVFNDTKFEWRNKDTQKPISLPEEAVITNDGMDMLPAEGELLWDKDVNIPFTSFTSSMYDSAKKVFTVKSVSYKLENPAATALVNDALEVLSNIKEDDVFKVENGVISIKSGGSGEAAKSEAPKFADNQDLSGASKSYKVGEKATTLEVEASVTDGGDITYTWYYLGDTPTAPASRANLPAATVVPGTGNQKTFTPPTDKTGRTFYYVEATNKTGDLAENSTQSEVAEIIVTEGVIEEGEFSVTDYVYNMEGKTIETMAKLKGKAPSGAKITIEANSEELAQVTADDNKEWEAVIPRQHAGTNIKVTAIANGKSAVDTYPVPQADGKQVDKFIEDIKLNEAIEVRDNLHNSKDGTDISKDAYWMTDNTKEEEEIEAFKVYVTLIETLLDYKPQISPVDLQYIQNVTLDAMKPYELKIKKGLKDVTATSELTLLVGGNKQGTVTIKDKDAGAIVGDTSSVTNGVYTINNGKKVTITATPNASNAVAGWLIDGKPSVETNKTTRELSINKDTSVQAIFAPEKDVPIIQEVIDIVKEITNNGEKPFEVSISNDNPTLEEIKTSVESTIKAMLPEGAEVDETKIEEAKTRATKNYTATVTFRVGDVTFTITIEISVNTGVSEVDLTLKLTGAEHGTVLSVMQEGKDVSTKGSVYTVKPGAEVTFTVKPNDGYKAKWSNNVKEVTSGNPNVVTITPTAPDTITLDFVEDKENTSAITLNVDPNGVVKVEVDGTSLTPTGNVYTVENGKTVTFTAIPKTGFEVEEWTGATVDPTNKNVATLKVTDKATVGVTFKEEGKEDPDQTTDAIKILSMQVDGGKFENISQSVTTNVYSNTVDGAVYQIYASLSDPVAKFTLNESGKGEAKFSFTLTAYSDDENFKGDAVTSFLKGLKIDTSNKVLMKQIKPVENGTTTLDITLSTDVIKSTDESNPTEFTIKFTYGESADPNIVKPLVGKAIQIKATTEN